MSLGYEVGAEPLIPPSSFPFLSFLFLFLPSFLSPFFLYSPFSSSSSGCVSDPFLGHHLVHFQFSRAQNVRGLAVTIKQEDCSELLKSSLNHCKCKNSMVSSVSFVQECRYVFDNQSQGNCWIWAKPALEKRSHEHIVETHGLE